MSFKKSIGIVLLVTDLFSHQPAFSQETYVDESLAERCMYSQVCKHHYSFEGIQLDSKMYETPNGEWILFQYVHPINENDKDNIINMIGYSLFIPKENENDYKNIGGQKFPGGILVDYIKEKDSYIQICQGTKETCRKPNQYESELLENMRRLLIPRIDRKSS